MKEVLAGVVDDIRNGRNIESYAVIAVAFLAALLAAFSVTGDAVSFGVILAVLSLIATQVLRISKRADVLGEGMKGVQAAVQSQASQGLGHFHDRDYAPEIRRATRVSMAAIANYRYLAANNEDFLAMLGRGGRIREMLLQIDSPAGREVATSRSVGPSQKPEHLENHRKLTMEKLHQFGSEATANDGVVVKESPYPPAHVITWIEFEDGPSRMYVTPTGFQQTTESRPTIVLDEHRDPADFEFFVAYFENLWGWEKARDVPL